MYNPFALDLSIIGCCWIEKLDNPIHIGSLISRTYGRTLAAGGGWLQSYARWPCRQQTRPPGGARVAGRAACGGHAAGGDGVGAGALLGWAERAAAGAKAASSSAKPAATVRRPHEYCLAGSRGRQGELEYEATAGGRGQTAPGLGQGPCCLGQAGGGQPGGGRGQFGAGRGGGPSMATGCSSESREKSNGRDRERKD